MLVKEQSMEIAILHKQGFSNRKIASTLGISRNTVKKYLASMEPIYKKRTSIKTKLEPYHDYLKQRVEAARPEWLPASVLFLAGGKSYRLKDKMKAGIISEFIEPQVALNQGKEIN